MIVSDEIVRTPIKANIIQRVSQGVRYMISGVKPDTWMSPNQPILPIAQEVKGRQYDYPVAQNLDYSVRVGSPISWHQLRGLADNYDLLRLAIETRKDQISKLEWSINPKDKKAKGLDNKIQEITEFLSFPDKFHNWDSWLRMLLEDLLVIDAPVVYPRMTNGKKIYSLELMDGATVRRMINDDGRTPIPPDVAYQQVLKGVPAVDYTADELIYYPRNLRTHRVYGYSPVEQIIMTVNIAMRRQIYQLQYYTEGNIPDAFISVPEEWNTNQIREFQEWWDTVNSGNTGQRRKAKFIAGGASIHETKESPLKDEYDEWLAKLVLYAFNLSPQALSKQMNRASAQTAQETAQDEGVAPIMIWVKNLIDFIIVKYFNYNDVEFTWKEEIEQDALNQAKLNDIYIKNGTKSVDEVRAELGLDPIGMPNAIYTAMGATLVKDVLNPPEPVATDSATQTQPNGQKSLQAPKDDNKNETSNATDTQPDKKADTKKLLKREKKKPVLKRIDRDRASVNKNIAKLQSILAKFLKKQGKNIAKQIISRLKKSDDDDIDSILNDIDLDGFSVVIGDVKKMLQQMGEDGAKLAYMQIGAIPDDEEMVNTSDAGTIDYATRRAAELVGMRYNKAGELIQNPSAKWAITDSTRDMLKSTLVKALDEGWSNTHLADEIENNFAFSASRAETIARTELKRADTQGSLEAYKASGMVEGKESLLSEDHDDDDECDDNADAGVIPLDEDFPSGDDAPPYHPRCNCDITPVLMDKGDSDNDEDENTQSPEDSEAQVSSEESSEDDQESDN